jgi:uncharacterized protein (DUF1330 family)
MEITDKQKEAVKKYSEMAKKIVKAYGSKVVSEAIYWNHVGYCQGGKK